MKDKHITHILSSMPLTDLSETELHAIDAHTGRCAACRRAYDAAQVSALLLRERAAEAFEPSPFFQTRVLAALRERQAARQTSVFQRMWQKTGALVASMAATVATLAVLTLLSPAVQTTAPAQEFATASNSYTADEVFFNRNELTDDQMTYEQVLTTLYEADEGAAR
jgi:predicted anti-sigma-YlaC factor YlaD